jgi:hypothetical protein
MWSPVSVDHQARWRTTVVQRLTSISLAEVLLSWLTAAPLRWTARQQRDEEFLDSLNGPVDPRLYEIGVSLAVGNASRRLTAAESRAVIDEFAAVRAEAAKWRLMLGRPGRILLIDPELCAEVSVFLTARA